MICLCLNELKWYSKDNSEEVIQARCHYEKAEVDDRVVFSLEDDAHAKVMLLNCILSFN